MSATAPIAALTVISIVVAALGLFVAGEVRLVALGMVGRSDLRDPTYRRKRSPWAIRDRGLRPGAR